ncbi:hypothetical protein [Pseudooceanicola nitratireducens]|uniref:hypothetical protein n=1 Tax=Pseudooceanicola nitratireducens TaxID=517719 RepID=UPI0023F33365|nr:hypothetical protein [Pseudooceanicola nitratireducens]
MTKSDQRREKAENLSKNSSRGFVSASLAPRTVGPFTVNFCRNPLCASFSLPPILFSIDPELVRGAIKGSNENRAYYCRTCGQGSRLKSNIALAEEYARLRTLNRGTKREYYLNSVCENFRVPRSLMPSVYRAHGKTPKGDPRFQCKACRKTVSIGSRTRRHEATKETGEILRLLVNNVPLRRIMEIAEVPADRLYNRIEFLAQQCRDFAAHKDKNLWKCFNGQDRVLSTDVQAILANWRHAKRILNVPIHHAVTVERDTGYVVAATTDYDAVEDPVEIEREMHRLGDFADPRAWRRHGRVWAYDEYRDSLVRGIQSLLSEEKKAFSSNTFDIPGKGARVRGDIFQAAHVMLVKKLIGSGYDQLLHCVDGDKGLAKLSASIFAKEVLAGRMHVADVHFTKELGNRKRDKLVRVGEAAMAADQVILGQLAATAGATYGLTYPVARLVAARLLRDYGAAFTGDRGQGLATAGYNWRYHRKEEPEKSIYLLTDRGDLSFGDLANLLTRASMAPVDKYFAQARRRIKAFDRGSRPTAGKTTWYVNAFYDPEMVDKAATILRFYYNFMLPESADGGKPKSQRQTPAMKIGLAKGRVYVRDVLSFS